jgi:murein DD-endopeptidase MepM/ murein hydrolase activator NlpD
MRQDHQSTLEECGDTYQITPQLLAQLVLHTIRARAYICACRAAEARAALERRPSPHWPATPSSLPLHWPRMPARVLLHLVMLVVAMCSIAAPVAPQSSVIEATLSPLASDAVVLVLAPLEHPLQRSEPAAPRQAPIDSAMAMFPEYHLLAEGETLADVADRYGVPVASVFWSNSIGDTGQIFAGQELRVPRVAGVPYIVQPGDTLDSIAAEFRIPVEAMTLFRPNQLEHAAPLTAGQELFVPGGSVPYPEALIQQLGGERAIADIRAVAVGAIHEDETNLRSGPGRAYPRVALLESGMRLLPIARHADWIQVEAADYGIGWVRADLIALSEAAYAVLPETNDFPPPPPRWVWPSYGQLTSSFGWRSVPYRSFHDGLDIANRSGTLVVAARAGVIFEAGWCRGFGYCVKIDHGGGLTTTYGHLLKRPRVSAGDAVEAGDPIGLMGSTYDRAGGGYSTGVHLHFTVKLNGKAVNPLKYLP